MASKGALPPDLNSFPKLLERNAIKFADRPAYREKEFGIWQSWTWAEAREEIQALRLWFVELGCRRATMSPSRAQPALLLLGDGRGAICGRDPGAALSGRGGRRDGLCPGSLRRAVCRGAAIRNRSTRLRVQRQAARARACGLSRSAGIAEIRPLPAACASRCRAGRASERLDAGTGRARRG